MFCSVDLIRWSSSRSLRLGNEIDLEWLSETKRIAGDELSDLKEASELFLRLFQKENIHYVNDIMLYAKTDTPALDAVRLTSILNTKSLNLVTNPLT